MKINRIAFTLTLATAMLTGTASWTPASAQHRGVRRAQGGEFAHLNLTADQKAQMRTIHEQQRTKLDALANQPLTRAQYRSQAAEIHKAGHDQIVNTVLTPDQRAQVAARESKREARRAQWRNSGGSTPPAKSQQ